MPTIDLSHSVARIVLDHPEAAGVFQTHRIDFCCHGDQALSEACDRAGADPGEVQQALEQALARTAGPPDTDFRSVSVAALIGYITERHHGWLRGALPRISSMAAKVSYVHGPRNASLADLHQAVVDLSADILPHLDREEGLLFPALLSPGVERDYVQEQLGQMVEEHEQVGRALTRIHHLAQGYVVPDWGCGTYRALFRELHDMEGDLLRHVHLENHVLMPRFAEGVSGLRRSA
jgi:regulator of cell morphogenesis and NO signaling